MSVTSGFFNSLNGDRRYNAEQMSAIFNGIINDGIFSNIGTAFSVLANTEVTNGITIGVGRAWFNSTWVYNDAILPMVANGSEVLMDRIDAVVIEINRSEAVRAGHIRFVYGTPATSPVKPTLTDTDEVHQHPLAYIYRTAGSTTITQADITNMVGTSECPYITGILETQNIDNIVAQWEAEFNTWFENLQDITGDDPLVSLANKILEMEAKFTELAKNRAVTSDLEDSSEDTIKDSNGASIQGQTVFALAGENTQGVATSVIEEKADIDELFKVGDTLTTARMDLSDNWVLCNGAEVPRDQYMALSNITPKFPNLNFSNNKVDSSFDIQTLAPSGPAFGAAYGGGYYVIGWSSMGSNDHRAVVSYTTDPTGSWSRKTIGNDNKGHHGIMCIEFLNGYFVAGGMDQINDDSSDGVDGAAAIYYTTPENISGTWSTSIINSNIGYDVIGIKYLNGNYIVLLSSNQGYAYLSSLSGPWTRKSLNMLARDIIYENGMYIFVGSNNNNVGQIAYFANLGDTPTIKTINNNYRYFSSIIYLNGYYLIGAYLDNYLGYDWSGLLRSSDITGEWEVIPIVKSASNGGVRSITVADGVLTVTLSILDGERYGAGIAYTADLISLSSFSIYDLFYKNAIPSAYRNLCEDYILTDDFYFICGLQLQNSDSGTYVPVAFGASTANMKIPEIAPSDSAYTYIKISEV